MLTDRASFCETVRMRTRLFCTAAVSSLLLVACGGSDDAATTTTTTIVLVEPVAPVATDATVATTPPPAPPTTVALVLEGATVIVANGNIVGGSAGRMTDALGIAGFTTAAPTNGLEKIEDSIVYYTATEGAQVVAESLGAMLGGVSVQAMPEPIPTETATLEGGDVLLVLGNLQADKSLAELSGSPAVEADAGASTIVVANASGIGGSAGRLSDALAASGHTVGTPTNSAESVTESIVYYTSADGAQADAENLGVTLGGVSVLAMPGTIPTDAGTLDGQILVLLGTNEADKTLAELAG